MTEADCPLCGDSFTDEQGVRDHAWDSHDACHLCGDRFDDREELYTHWLDVHEDELSTAARKRAANKVGDRTVCPVCDRRLGSKAAVADHARDVHTACHLCGDRFDDEEALDTHLLAVHGDELSRATRRRAESTVGDLTFRDRLSHQGPVAAIRGTSVSRRTLIGGSAAGIAVAAGGAFASGAFGGGGSAGSLDSHPAATALEREPVLGPPPGEADGTIIAFEDPSCPSCARFERGAFPKLKSELIDPGRVSFVYRGIPVVYDWGEPAVQALEATYARNEPDFWALKNFYYGSQSTIGSGNVRRATRRFLAERTEVDAAAVLDDVESGAYRDAVQTDLRASQDAGVRGTPTFYLFKDGSYLTDILGPKPYSVFKNALGVS